MLEYTFDAMYHYIPKYVEYFIFIENLQNKIDVLNTYSTQQATSIFQISYEHETFGDPLIKFISSSHQESFYVKYSFQVSSL